MASLPRRLYVWGGVHLLKRAAAAERMTALQLALNLHNREHRGNVGRYMAGRGGDSGWRLYVVTIHALEMLLPAVCERRSEDTFDQVLLASCEVGLLKDWSKCW